jgi:hypothetical protein
MDEGLGTGDKGTANTNEERRMKNEESTLGLFSFSFFILHFSFVFYIFI